MKKIKINFFIFKVIKLTVLVYSDYFLYQYFDDFFKSQYMDFIVKRPRFIYLNETTDNITSNQILQQINIFNDSRNKHGEYINSFRY